jgi:hypothetical protein
MTLNFSVLVPHGAVASLSATVVQDHSSERGALAVSLSIGAQEDDDGDPEADARPSTLRRLRDWLRSRRLFDWITREVHPRSVLEAAEVAPSPYPPGFGSSALAYLLGVMSDDGKKEQVTTLRRLLDLLDGLTSTLVLTPMIAAVIVATTYATTSVDADVSIPWLWGPILLFVGVALVIVALMSAPPGFGHPCSSRWFRCS